MRQFNKTSKFGRRDSGRPERRDSGRPNNNSSRSERRFDRRDSNRSRSRSSGLELHEAICTKCGIKCEVPFEPSSNKPVYCRSCFKQNYSSESRSRADNFRSRGRSNDRFESKIRANPSSEELDKINMKLDKIMKSLNIE